MKSLFTAAILALVLGGCSDESNESTRSSANEGQSLALSTTCPVTPDEPLDESQVCTSPVDTAQAISTSVDASFDLTDSPWNPDPGESVDSGKFTRFVTNACQNSGTADLWRCCALATIDWQFNGGAPAGGCEACASMVLPVNSCDRGQLVRKCNFRRLLEYCPG